MDKRAPPQATRRLVHTRKIDCNGYLRRDGMMEVEAAIHDISPHRYDLFLKTLGPGEDLHHMRITLTLDTSLVIRHVQVHTPWCAEGNSAYDGLIGMQTQFEMAREAGSLKALHAQPGFLPRPALANTCQAYRTGAKALEAIWSLHQRAPSTVDEG